MLCEEKIPNILFETLNTHQSSFDLIASVVMPDHIHFVLLLNHSKLGQAIKIFKGKSGIEINRILSRSGQIWQKGYFDHKFRSDDDLEPILNYMWNNPETPGRNFRCNQDDWIWFKRMVAKKFEYPEWLKAHPLG